MVGMDSQRAGWYDVMERVKVLAGRMEPLSLP